MSEAVQGAGTMGIGDALRSAREAKGMSLDDVARETRVPTRHLQHIENEEWAALPAITYSVGFARAYANAVGLEGSRLAAELRSQLGSPQSYGSPIPVYQPADPSRVPPRSLALVAALLALILVGAYLIWRSGMFGPQVEEIDPAALEVPIAGSPATPQAPSAPLSGPQPAAATGGAVLLTATEEVWLRVYEPDGGRLFEKQMAPGDTYEVPATAAEPLLVTGRPNALRVTVGATEIPPLGPPERRISDVSLSPRDLLARLQPAAPAAAAPPAQ